MSTNKNMNQQPLADDNEWLRVHALIKKINQDSELENQVFEQDASMDQVSAQQRNQFIAAVSQSQAAPQGSSIIERWASEYGSTSML